MIEILNSIDLTVFYFFNHTLSSAGLNRFFSTITNVNNWFITYVILWGILAVKGKLRGRIAAVGIIFLILISDQTGYRVLKEYFERIRPCNALPDVLTPLGCNGTYSFPSNHALNNFAAATFFYILYPNYKWILFVTAALVAISRIYLGLHYPSDILGGAVIGAAFGYLFAYVALKVESFINQREEIKNRLTH